MLRSCCVSGLGMVPGRSSIYCWDGPKYVESLLRTRQALKSKCKLQAWKNSQNSFMSQHCYCRPKSTSYGRILRSSKVAS